MVTIPQPLNTASVYLIVSALFFQIKWNLSLKIMIYLVSTDHRFRKSDKTSRCSTFSLAISQRQDSVHMSHVDATGAAAWMPCWVHWDLDS